MSTDLTDLDFTSVALRPRPAPPAPPRVEATIPPRVQAPAPRNETPRTEAEIGKLRREHAGNFICYARGGGGRDAAPDAPIVLVDDDVPTRLLLEKVLQALGYPARSAGDSQELVQLMRQPPLPRLILIDVELPHVNGFKILTALRKHPQTGAIPLVMLTGRSEPKDLLHALSLGADGYLSKPVSVTSLRTTLDRLLKKPA